MNKKEVIESVVNVTIPEGATLVERELPFGVKVSRVGNNPGGMSIAMSRIFHACLIEDAGECGEDPCAELFEALHVGSIHYHAKVLEAFTIPQLEKGIVESHRKVVLRLREISTKLGIPYQEPADPFL